MATNPFTQIPDLFNIMGEYIRQCSPEIIKNGTDPNCSSTLVRYPGQAYVLCSMCSTHKKVCYTEAPNIKQVYRINGYYGGLLIEPASTGPVVVINRLDISHDNTLPSVGVELTHPFMYPALVSAYLNDGIRTVVPIRHGLEVTNHTGLRVRLFCNGHAFVALFPCDGKVLAWGQSTGGVIPHTTTRILAESHVVDIYPHLYGFIARTREGRVITWGVRLRDGRIVGMEGSSPSPTTDLGLRSGVTDVFVNHEYSFVAYNATEKKLIAWGGEIGSHIPDHVHDRIRKEGVSTVVSVHTAFAALTQNGNVVVWGPHHRLCQTGDNFDELHDIEEIVACDMSFVAIRRGRKEIVICGPRAPPDEVHAEIKLHGVHSIYSNMGVTAIKLGNEQCMAWGRPIWNVAFGRTPPWFYTRSYTTSVFSAPGKIADIHHSPHGFIVVQHDGHMVYLMTPNPLSPDEEQFLQRMEAGRSACATTHSYTYDQFSKAMGSLTVEMLE